MTDQGMTMRKRKPFGHKPERNRRVVEMWETGDYKLEELGKEFDPPLSRQRVHQIIVAYGNRKADTE